MFSVLTLIFVFDSIQGTLSRWPTVESLSPGPGGGGGTNCLFNRSLQGWGHGITLVKTASARLRPYYAILS
jgi:hypothetical protein